MNFVLSSHADAINSGSEQHFELNRLTTIVIYDELGNSLQCSNADPGRVCYGQLRGRQSFEPGSFFPNYYLWNDENRAFYSGVKHCESNQVIINIDSLPDRPIVGTEYVFKATLKEIVDHISSFGNPFTLHLLMCYSGLNKENASFYSQGFESAFSKMSIGKKYQNYKEKYLKYKKKYLDLKKKLNF